MHLSCSKCRKVPDLTRRYHDEIMSMGQMKFIIVEQCVCITMLLSSAHVNLNEFHKKYVHKLLPEFPKTKVITST